VDLVIALVIVVACAAAAVGVLLAVRRGAPDGGYFHDGDRAAGVFGVLATGFSVLLGFVVFLAFTSYDVARSGAESEARVVAHQVQSALLLPDEISGTLVGQLQCYARSVVGVQWDRMASGELGDDLNPWAVAMFRTIEPVEPESASEQAAFGEWLDLTADREEARLDRIHGAAGVIPAPLWIVSFFVTAVIFVFMLFFADSGERAVVQGVQMASVVSVIVAMLLLLWSLDHPFHDGVGGLRPTAMTHTLRVIEEELGAADPSLDLVPPCDDAGEPTS
jgi:hypothetical protein